MEIRSVLANNLTIGGRDDPVHETKSALEQESPDVLIFPEHAFYVGDVIKNYEAISKLSQEHQADVLMVPKNWESESISNPVTITQMPGMQFEEMRPGLETDSIGIWFYKDGGSYVFAKRHEPAIHCIPRRDVCISICSEAKKIDPAIFSSTDAIMKKILYVPTSDGYGAFIRAKTMERFGASKQEIKEVYSRMSDRLITSLPSHLDPLISFLGQYNIPAIRSDDCSKRTGVLFLPAEWAITDLDYTDQYCALTLQSNSS